MRREKYYRFLFLTGAFWNWTVATVFFFASEPLIRNLGMAPLRYTVPLKIAMSMVFIYGIAYFNAYRDNVKNRNIVKLGVYGKIMVFALLVNSWLIGDIAFGMVIPGIVDLIFAGLFLEFLASTSNFSLSDIMKSLASFYETSEQ
jgi:hypothetical protein